MDISYEQEKLAQLAEERYKLLIEESVYVPGVSDQVDPEKPPEWFDLEKFQKAQQLARKYLVSLFFGHLAGLLLVIQLPAGLAPLLATGNSSSISRLFRRYLSTQLHVKSWYETDPFNPESKGYKSVKQVRGMHKRIMDKMNKKTGKVTGNDKIWVTQYDMALTQWAFIGLPVMYPKQCGMHPITRDELDALNYFWRVMGHLMGIEDRFNLCNGSYEESFVYYKLIYDRTYHPTLTQVPHPAPVGFAMSEGIVKALNRLSPSLHWSGVMQYWYKTLNVPVEVRMTKIRHRIGYGIMIFMFHVLLKLSIFHWILSSILRMNINILTKRKLKYEEKLKKKYPHIRYEERCPLSLDIDYVDINQDKIDKSPDFNENIV